MYIPSKSMSGLALKSWLVGFGINRYSSTGYDVCEVFQFCLHEGAFLCFQLQSSCLQPLDATKVGQVLLYCTPHMMSSSSSCSIFTKHLSRVRPARTVSMSLWKVAGALQSPKGIT